MKLVSAALLAVFIPAIASAQTSGWFIQAGPLADFVFTGSADDYPVTPALVSSRATYSWVDLNGDRRWQPGEEGPPVSTSLFPLPFPIGDGARASQARVAPGASAAVGVFITPSISLRLEGSFQGERVTTREVGLGSLISITDRHATATTDIFVAAGWHQGGTRRTTINYLAGMVFRRHREEFTFGYQFSPRALPPQIGLGQIIPAPGGFEDGFDATSYSAGMMAGVDVAIRLSEHLAVVPQVRLVAANRSLSARPGVALRWHP